MDRRQVDREVRAALRDPKRHWQKRTHSYPFTIVEVIVRHVACWNSVFSYHEVKCAPDDEYSEQVGYELALDRCIHDIVDQIMAEQEPPKPAQPRRKQAVKAEQDPNESDKYICYVWCDADLVRRIEALPFVDHVGDWREWYETNIPGYKGKNNPLVVHLDHRYDTAECIAAIEAVGREQ